MTDIFQRLQLAAPYSEDSTALLYEAAECIKALRKELEAMYTNHPESACYDVSTWGKLREELAAMTKERDLYKRANELKAEYIKDDDLQSAWEKFKLTATDNFTSFVAGWHIKVALLKNGSGA